MVNNIGIAKSAAKDATTRPDTHPDDKYFFQYVVAISATLLMMSCGFMLGWSSPAIPKLLQPDSPVTITLDQSSWIIALIEVGFFITAFPSAWMMNRIGRKTLMIMGVIPVTAAWILVGTASTVIALYVARVLMGFMFGFYVCVLPVYVAEIASPKIRGRLMLILTVMSEIGTVTTFAIGPFVSYMMLSFAALIPLAFFCVCTIWVPESPYYLLSQGRAGEALTSLTKLRGHTDVQNELQAMSVAVIASQDNKGTFRELFYNYGNRRAIIIMFGLTVGQCLSGGLTIVSYAQTIFHKIGNDMDAGTISIVFGCVQLVAGIGAVMLIDYLGRRFMLMTSVIGTILSSFVLGLYFFMARQNSEVVAFSWLPVTAMMLYISFYFFGLGTIVYCMAGELFPQNLKQMGGFVYIQVSAVLIFVMHKLFQIVSDDLGSDVTFWSITIMMVCFLPFVYFWLPETKGKKLETILTELNTRKNKTNEQQ